MGSQKSAEGIVGFSTGPKARTCSTGQEPGISMQSTDVAERAEMPVTASDDSGLPLGLKPRRAQDGVNVILEQNTGAHP